MLTKTQLDTHYLNRGMRQTTEEEYRLYALACEQRNAMELARRAGASARTLYTLRELFQH